jgi:ribosomal protein S18 acetylase RimI-like enzyme
MTEHKIVELIPQNNEEDYNMILPAFLSIWNDLEHHKFLTFTLQLFTKEMASSFFKHHLDQGCRYFAVIDDLKTIFALSVIKINNIESFDILGLGVRPEFKHKGIGGSLIKHAIDLAASLGFKAIDASVFADNTNMMRVLLSFNFMPIRINNHARADGIDLVVMKKYL